MANCNALAEQSSNLHYECIDVLAKWMEEVDTYLGQNYDYYDDIHIDIWEKPDWSIKHEPVDYHVTSQGVMYLFEYKDSYDDICDRNVALFVYDSWMNMTIEEVCADIVQKSRVKLDEERKKELDRIKREALELGLKLTEENEND